MTSTLATIKTHPLQITTMDLRHTKPPRPTTTSVTTAGTHGAGGQWWNPDKISLGLQQNFILHYHAPRDLEKFRSRSTTTRRGTLKKFTLHYHAQSYFEIFSFPPQARATRLRPFG